MRLPGASWDEQAKAVPAALITDCKSLHDSLRKTDSATSEKRVALDLEDVRCGIEAGTRVFWLPTAMMPADALTKRLPELAKGPLARLMAGRRVSLRAPDCKGELRLPKEAKTADAWQS